jgi:hypothetical protein
MIESLVLGAAAALIGVYIVQPAILWLLDNI